MLQIRKIARLKNKSIKEVAEEAQTTRESIYLYDQGAHIPRLDTALNIAKVLDVTVDELIREEFKVMCCCCGNNKEVLNMAGINICRECAEKFNKVLCENNNI